MSWAKLDDEFYDHPKVLAAGLAATGLFARTLSYCARKLTDGFVPHAAIPMLANGEEHAPLTNRLVEVGLFHEVTGGYLVHDYLHFNPAAKHVKQERARAAERMVNVRRRSRERAAERSANGVRNTSRSSASPSPSPSPIPSPDPVPVPGPEPVPERGAPADAGAARVLGNGTPDTPERRQMGLLPARGPVPEEMQLTADGARVMREGGCTNPPLGFRHFVMHYREKASDLTIWSDRWDLKLAQWALRHAQMGCPCQRRATPADRERDAEGRRREAAAAGRSRGADAPAPMGDVLGAIARGTGR